MLVLCLIFFVVRIFWIMFGGIGVLVLTCRAKFCSIFGVYVYFFRSWEGIFIKFYLILMLFRFV